MANAATVLSALKKEHGDHIGNIGVALASVSRIPTGLFPFDLATGGGFPQGRISIVYGGESSGKTSLTMKAIAYVQNTLGMKACFVDIENAFDPGWAQKNGVILEELVHFVPDTAEQAVDVVEAMLHAEDVGLVVMDSVGALTTSNEIESGADKQIVGGASLLAGKLIRKATMAMSKEQKNGHHATLILINQTRTKIGVMYGDPETTPGGALVRFASSLSIRLYGKDEIVKEVSDKLPAVKKTSGIIKKWKVPVYSRNFEYDFTLIPHDGLGIGQAASWNTVANHLKAAGVLKKAEAKQAWECMGTEVKTLEELKLTYQQDVALQQKLQAKVVEICLADGLDPQE
jgi:recombination protein RecA